MRVCPARAEWGGRAGSPSTSALLVLIAALITEPAVPAGCQDGSVGFLFLLLPLLIEFNSDVQNNSVISGCLVRHRSKQVHLKTSAF